MRLLAIGMIAVALGTGTARAEDCSLKQFGSVPMEIYPDHLLIPVAFGTMQEKLVFRMDDAASGINSDFAQKLDLYVTSIPPNIHFHRDGDEIKRIAHVPELHLGQQTLRDMEFLMLRPGRYSGDVVGDLGTHLFKNVDFELDMAGGKLNMFRPIIARERRSIGPRRHLRSSPSSLPKGWTSSAPRSCLTGTPSW